MVVEPEFDRASPLLYGVLLWVGAAWPRIRRARLFRAKDNAKVSLSHRVLTPTVPPLSFGLCSSPFHRFGCFVRLEPQVNSKNSRSGRNRGFQMLFTSKAKKERPQEGALLFVAAAFSHSHKA